MSYCRVELFDFTDEAGFETVLHGFVSIALNCLVFTHAAVVYYRVDRFVLVLLPFHFNIFLHGIS